MDIEFFLRGLVIGFLIAAPVGPIGVLCIRRTLAYGLASGFVSGMGAATADAVYGCIAGFGLTFISSILVEQAIWIRLIGGAFLCYLGIKTVLAKPANEVASTTPTGLATAYASTVLLTLTNPTTILSFAAVFAGFGLASQSGNYLTASLLVLGVFIGSAVWWLVLSGGVSLLRHSFNAEGLRWLNRISGAILLTFGIIALHRWE
ncbi:MAG: LysE family translocator [Elainellaceae cyanobacterium]